MHKVKGKRQELQQTSSITNQLEISTDEYYLGKDFNTLMNAPLSKGGHFVFKSEKAWSVDPSQYSEFFTLDVETLSAAIDCIPFNKYVDVDEKYFISDQLTSINNDVEKGKAIYNAILDKNMLSSLDTTCLENETRINTKTDQSNNLKLKANVKYEAEDSNNLEEEIEPWFEVIPHQKALAIWEPPSRTKGYVTPCEAKPYNVSTKPIDLEKWLDSILDD